MSILRFLGFSDAQEEEDNSDDTETVRRIVAELERLEPAKARYVAGFAYVLSRAAAADLRISDEETETMVQVLKQLGHLPEEQAVLVVAIAKSRSRLFGGTEDFLVTRQFREISTVDQRRELLDCLFAVSAADSSVSSAEEAQIRQIASELGFEHKDYIQARTAYARHRSVLHPPRKPDSRKPHPEN
jgi:uncharacterized tellurite resistance protein B-like protein